MLLQQTKWQWDHTMQGVLVVKICRYLRAAAIMQTAVVRAFRAQSANNTFWNRKRQMRLDRADATI